MRAGKTVQCCYLIQGKGFGLLLGQVDDPAAKPLQIRVARMCPNRHAAADGELHGAIHHQGVSSVHPTGYVGRCDVLHHLIIFTQLVATKTLAEIAI